jgi:hypothetical protein
MTQSARNPHRNPPQYGQTEARKAAAPYTMENDLAVTVAEALNIMLPPDAVWTAWDNSNAGVIEGGRKKRMGVKPGWPDLGVFWRGRVILMELKRKQGRVSVAQNGLHSILAAVGFPVRVCRSADDVLATLTAAGIPLRGRVMA